MRKQQIILSDGTTRLVLSDTLENKSTVGEKYGADEYKDKPNAKGIYEKDDLKLEKKENVQSVQKQKQQKQKELDELQVSLNSVSYDAHMEGLGNMGIVVGGMTYKALKAMAKLSPDMQAIYDETFKQTVQWKGADNKLHTVQVESLAQTLEEAMNEKAQILYKY
jgi:hypothetical protein